MTCRLRFSQGYSGDIKNGKFAPNHWLISPTLILFVHRCRRTAAARRLTSMACGLGDAIGVEDRRRGYRV
jgi:hypothetical protein